MSKSNLFMFLGLVTKTKIKGNTKFAMKTDLRNLLGLIVETSESAKGCGQFHVFGTFLHIFFERLEAM